MLLSAALFLLQIPFSRGTVGTGAAISEKRANDLRYFVNVTFDWSSRKYGRQEIKIPECHEKMIRRSYYDLSFPMQPIIEARAFTPDNLRTGHLVFPLVVSVFNETMSRRDYFAVAIHKLFAREDSHKIDHLFPIWKTFALGHEGLKVTDLFTKIIIVSEATWKSVWSLWERAIEEGNMLCNGGMYFSQLLPIIQEEEKTTPQYDDIVQNYTEITTEVCGAVRCGIPSEQSETVSLAYPTAEGVKLFETPAHYQNPVTRKDGIIRMNFLSARLDNDSKMWACVRDYYHKKDTGRYFEQETVAEREMKVREEVFRPMYCKSCLSTRVANTYHGNPPYIINLTNS